MKLKQIGLSSMILTGLLATNAVHAQDETIIEDNSIQVVSIYKTSDASSVEQKLLHTTEMLSLNVIMYNVN